MVLQLALAPEVTFAELARRTGVSVGEAHNAVKRLEGTPMFLQKGRAPNTRRLLEFLIHGVPNVFPGRLGPVARGIPTAHSGPDLRNELVFDMEIVWPSAEGDVRGHTLVPLVPGAVQTAAGNPELYRLLCLVDALRVGRARERKMAASLLRDRLGNRTP